MRGNNRLMMIAAAVCFATVQPPLLRADDCNTNGTDDGLELPAGDCNTNLQLDTCELSGASTIDIVADPQSPIQVSGLATGTISLVSVRRISDVNVQIFVQHGCVRSLRIQLAHLNTTVTLTESYFDGCRSNYTGTVFDDDAQMFVSSGTAPFSNTFKPRNPLSVFNGQLANGAWTLSVGNTTNLSSGQLASWQLHIKFGKKLDCNTNSVPDECELSGSDCNSNGVMDACDDDCNTDGVADVCASATEDCNTNAIPDACDLLNALAIDCNTNASPDTCELSSGAAADCDTNGVIDACYIADANTDLTPDACQVSGDYDCNLDGVFDGIQIQPFMQRISIDETGATANNRSWDAAISGSGRFVSFFSDASNLVAGDANTHADVFVYDLVTRTFENVHISSTGAMANDNAFATMDITHDGRFVAFASYASNLTMNGNLIGVLLFDRQQRVMRSVSMATLQDPFRQPGNSFAPAISEDGRFVAFASYSELLTAVEGHKLGFDVYVRDREAQATTLVSIGPGGAVDQEGDSGPQKIDNTYYASSRQVVMTPNARYIAYASYAKDLVPGDTNNARDVFVYDRILKTTECVSVGSDGSFGNAHSSNTATTGIDISEDGRYVVFESDASNLVPGDTNNRVDLFVRDRWLNQTYRLPIGGASPTPRIFKPSFSRDRRYVVFTTTLLGLVPFQNNAIPRFVRYDRMTDSLLLIDTDPTGMLNGGNVFVPKVEVSADGQLFAFCTITANIVPGPPDGSPQVYLRNAVPADQPDCDTNGQFDSCQLLGNDLDCNANGTVDLCDSQADYLSMLTNINPRLITDLNTAMSPINPQTMQAYISDVNVQINIQHPVSSQLSVALIHGSKTVTLTSVLGTAANYTNTVFDQQAAQSISAGASPFTATYRPLQNLNVFNGMPMTGLWRLKIYDSVTLRTGTLLSWSLLTRHLVVDDCNSDGVPDTCQLSAADCNSNNSLDICEQSIFDANSNGTLDVCDCPTCPGDVNIDNRVDGRDIGGWVRCSLGSPQSGDICGCTIGMSLPSFVNKLLADAQPNCP